VSRTGSKPLSAPERKQTLGKRLALAAIPVTCLIALFGFWRLSPGVTFGIALLALAALLAALWLAGKDD
jgi:hypothetical protein